MVIYRLVRHMNLNFICPSRVWARENGGGAYVPELSVGMYAALTGCSGQGGPPVLWSAAFPMAQEEPRTAEAAVRATPSKAENSSTIRGPKMHL